MNDKIPDEPENEETVGQMIEKSAGASLPLTLVVITWVAAAYIAVLMGFAIWSLIP
jgi:hypothetical protein